MTIHKPNKMQSELPVQKSTPTKVILMEIKSSPCPTCQNTKQEQLPHLPPLKKNPRPRMFSA